MIDDPNADQQPRCEVCGTVMYVIDGGFECRGCGYRIDIPWVMRVEDGDDLPSIRGW